MVKVTTPIVKRGGFPIPDLLQDFFNRILQKVESLYVRKEQAATVEYEYETIVYRGVPIKVIKQIKVQYDSSKPQEVFTAVRSSDEDRRVIQSVRLLR